MESARTFLARISSVFYHRHSYTSEATELQQTPKQGIFSRHGPRTVEVAAVQDKKPLFVSPRPNRQQQQSSQSYGHQSSSQTQPTDALTSAALPGTYTTTPSAAATRRRRRLTLWARLVLFLCCASSPHADGR